MNAYPTQSGITPKPFCILAGCSRRGFTLIELLTVIAVIAVLATILIAATGRIRQTALKAHAIKNIGQLHAGMSLYAFDNSGALPPAMVGSTLWSSHLAPYLESGNLRVGGNNLFYDLRSGRNALTDAHARTLGQKSPFSNPVAVQKYPLLVVPSFAINAYLYIANPDQGNMTISWASEPQLSQASRPSQTVLFIDAHLKDRDTFCTADGVSREEEVSTTVPLFSHGLMVGWMDGHVSIEPKESLFSQQRRPGGGADIWRLYW